MLTQRLDIRGDVTIGQDTSIDINVILEGQVSIGKTVLSNLGDY
nr:hypothetical protein [Piscirickettsia salmonis]